MALTDFSSSLLRWYDAVARDLPWRRTRDPYAIWISEIMLQQTRVETVLDYYRRFLERFPTVGDLARAATEEVLALWSGLGYYRRARQLHGAAQEVAARGGELPGTAAELRQLAGIGDYTAAAVASIAFGEVIPVLDGNVERVLCRLLAVAENPKKKEPRRRLLTAAAGLLDHQRPGDSNQALMELGATVCLPRAPRCPACPLASACAARAQGEPERFPTPKVRKAPLRIRRWLAVVERGERWLLFRRPEEEELLAGIWELPWVEVDGAAAEEEARVGAERLFAQRFGGVWTLKEALGTVRSTITYRTIEYRIFRATIESGGYVEEGPEAGFFSPASLRDLPVSSQVLKVLRLLGAEASD
jgi:A/G-specific adenine glycosylase